MPLAPIKQICSFSSEDPEYPALNLLDINSEKKWKTLGNGEKLAYVILQLENPGLITGIDVGNEYSAFIEIHVGRSEEQPVQFEQLVSRSLFMTPFESKKSIGFDRIRSFGKEKILQSDLRKWDLVKIICTQPFNKQIQYGLAFVKIRVKPSGNRFIRRKIVTKEQVNANISIDSSKNNQNVEPSPELKQEKEEKVSHVLKENDVKHLQEETENLNDQETTHSTVECNNSIWDKNANELLKSQTNFKTQDFEPEKLGLPNTSIGNIDKALQAIEKAEQISKKLLNDISSSSKNIRTEGKHLVPSKSEYIKNSSSHQPNIISDNLINRNKNKYVTHKPFNKLLEDVVFLISGLQNPDFSEIRHKASKMGAVYKSDWQNGCTHLICVFKGTPKYKIVKRNNGRIVKRDWIEACYALRKRLPWRRFALDSEDRIKNESDHEILEITANSIKSTTSLQFTENEKFKYNLNLLPKKSSLQTGIKGNNLKNKITKFLLPDECDSKYNICETIPENDQNKIKGLAGKSMSTGNVSQHLKKFESEINQRFLPKLQKSSIEIVDTTNFH